MDMLILIFLCVAACHLSSASPVLRSALVVQAGQNASLSCNLTSSVEITWYVLHSDQLLPLLTVTSTKLGLDTVNNHTADSRIRHLGNLESSVSLEILEVEVKDGGLYFCTGRCGTDVCVHNQRLVVDGVDGESARLPCWSVGICVLPALLVFCLVSIVGVFLQCSGKPAVCCCNSGRGNTSLKVTEDASLHYSSLRHADKPRPSDRGRTRFVEEGVTYSAVAGRKNPNGSRDHR